MAKENLHEVVSEIPAAEYFRERTAQGWRLKALEWERDVRDQRESQPFEEVPFGLRIAADCLHLEKHPTEQEALSTMLNLLVDDTPLPQVVAELNRQGFRTRSGSKWTQTAVFNLLPRLIDAAPQIYPTAEWETRRSRPSLAHS